MKKCASCTKDLPDAALHCVFCGAKQAPAPASTPAMAKTVMGYGNNPELDALRAKAAAANAAAGQRPSSPSTPPPVNPVGATLAAPPSAAPYSPPAPPRANPSQPPPMAPASAANAPTMFVQPGGAPGPGPVGPSAMGSGAMPPGGGGMHGGPHAGHNPMGGGPMGGGHAPPVQPPAPSPYPVASAVHAPPMAPAPAVPVPQAPPFLASQTAARTNRPVDPFKDSLRLMMFIWGALLIAAFVTPLSLDPMWFSWDVITDGEGSQKLEPLIIAAVGLLSIVVASIPLASGARGAIAALLGLTGVFVPMFLRGTPEVLPLVGTIGVLLLIPSLLARHEYRDAALPRILATVGAIAALVPWVVPQHDVIMVVALFEGAIELPGGLKIIAILMLVNVVLYILSFLAWLPAPASGGAKTIAWLLILFPLIAHVAVLFLAGDPSVIEKSPYLGVARWITGGIDGSGGGGGGLGALMLGGLTLGVAYLAITGYGAATVIGKKLE